MDLISLLTTPHLCSLHLCSSASLLVLTFQFIYSEFSIYSDFSIWWWFRYSFSFCFSHISNKSHQDEILSLYISIVALDDIYVCYFLLFFAICGTHSASLCFLPQVHCPILGDIYSDSFAGSLGCLEVLDTLEMTIDWIRLYSPCIYVNCFEYVLILVLPISSCLFISLFLLALLYLSYSSENVYVVTDLLYSSTFPFCFEHLVASITWSWSEMGKKQGAGNEGIMWAEWKIQFTLFNSLNK